MKMTKYRPDIDGLRAIAVLSVILFHFEPKLLAGGFTGVDIFFVISGYLISGIIFSASSDKPFTYKRFYFNRAKRILPALLLVAFAVAVTGLLILMKDELEQLGNHLVATASFNSNFQLWREAGYFDAKSETKPLLHLWSLAVEEQFYFVWPALLLIVRNRNKQTLLLIVTGIAISLGWSIHKTQIGDQPADFYSPLTRFWEIWVGALLAYLSLFMPRPLQWIRGTYQNLFSWVGLFLCCFSFFYFNNKNIFFPGYWVLLPVLGTFLIIAAGESAWLNRKLLSHPKMVFIGLISYPLYLWHWPLLSFLQIISNGTSSLIARTGALVIAFILAWLTYEFVEKKIRFNKNQEPRTIALLLVGMIIILLIGLGLNQNKIKGRLHGPEFDNIIEAKYNYKEGNYYHSLIFKGQTDQKVLLLGDSHMGMYLPRVEVLYAQKLPPLLSAEYMERSDGWPLLLEWAKKAAADTKVIKVSLSYHWETNRFYLDSDTETVAQEFKKALEIMIAAKKKVVMVTSTPSGLVFAPNYLVDRIGGRVISQSEAPSLPVSDFRAKSQERLQQLVEIAKSLGVEILDPVDFICAQGQCPSTVDGDPLFYDTHHLRPKFVRQMQWLDRLITE